MELLYSGFLHKDFVVSISTVYTATSSVCKNDMKCLFYCIIVYVLCNIYKTIYIHYTYIGYKKCVCNTNNALCLQGKNCTASPGLSFYIGLPVIWETCLPGNLSNGPPVYWVTCLQGNRPQGKLSVLYSTVYRVTCLHGNLSIG